MYEPDRAGMAAEVEGCGRRAVVRGWCRTHYRRWQKWGMVLAAIPIGDQRLLAVQKQCERCGKTYRAARCYQRWCLDCRPQAQREQSTAYMYEHRQRNPELFRARARAWVKANPAVTAPIIGARNVEQLKDSLAAADYRMTTEQWQQISDLTPPIPTATDRSEKAQP